MAVHPALRPGRLLTDNIRLVRMLGEGGMGSVWIADHLTLSTQVAVKFMSLDLAEDQSAVARFTREATAAAQVKSPHIVQTFDHGVTDDHIPYIVMELLEGEDLGDRVDRAGPLSPKDASIVISQLCKALAKAHGLGIVHRDIKPDNVFLVANDEEEIFVKVLDFGIAKKPSEDKSFSMTTTGAVVGTPYYMSPEQLQSSKHVDHRADLWSVGVVAYLCMTGKVPFDAENFASLCIAIDRGVFPKPGTVRQGIPPAVDAWFARALQRDASDRFGSAREMADALAAAVRDAPAASAIVVQSESLPLDATMPGSMAAVSQVPRPPTLAGATISGQSPRRAVPWRWIGGVAALVVIALTAGALAMRSSSPEAVTPDRGVVAASVSVPPAATTSLSPPIPAEPATQQPTASSAPEPSRGSPAVASAPPPPRPGKAAPGPSPKTRPPVQAAAPTEPDRGF